LEHHPDSNAAVVVALALAAGMVAQVLARHVRLPGIVLLLTAGVLLGPDVVGVVNPADLGPALHTLVGFAVAVILFEGGMNLNLKRLRREAAVIRSLLTIGAAITAVGSTLAALYFMQWDWRLAVAFGTLVIVTGPTVVTPILRRVKVKHTVATVIEAEGVLIDAIGAVLAVVTLQVIIGSSIGEGGMGVTAGLLSIVERLGFGLVFGLIGGYVIALLLRIEKAVPEGLENVFGVMTVTAAGMVVGNFRTLVHRDLIEFKEQLTVMLIGMLFVLLAADVRLAEVQALGLPGVLTVATLILIVRPLNIFISTLGSNLTLREKVFLSWLAPRGVVAAAIATLFAQSFTAAGIPGGKQLQAIVFLVIAVTVVVQGLSAGMVAQFLGLRRPSNEGYAILGANEMGLVMGRLLRMSGEEVLFIDSSPRACQQAEEDGFRVIFGNVIHERTLQRAQLDSRAACVAATSNEEVNLLFARTATREFKVPRVYVACRRDRAVVNTSIILKSGAEVLFGMPRDLDMWSVRLRRGNAVLETWRLEGKSQKSDPEAGRAAGPFGFPRKWLLPMVMQRSSAVFPVSTGRDIRKNDVVHFAVFAEEREQAHVWLRENEWVHIEELNAAAPVIGARQAAADAQASRAW
jgi:NhaP-type Na+/H+ or K+/H+ antiporter